MLAPPDRVRAPLPVAPTATLFVADRAAPALSLQLLPPNARLVTVPVPAIVPPPVMNCAVSAASGARAAGFRLLVVSFQFAAVAKSVFLAPVQASVRGGGWMLTVLATGADVAEPSST